MGFHIPILWYLYLVAVSGQLFENTAAFETGNTTELGTIDTPVRYSSKADNYEVKNHTAEDAPPAYQALMNDRKRRYKGYKGEQAFTILGKTVGATGLASKGTESSILNIRTWAATHYIKPSDPLWSAPKWRFAAIHTNVLLSAVFSAIGGSDGNTNCLPIVRDQHNGVMVNAFGTGYSTDAIEQGVPYNDRQHFASDDIKKGFYERWQKKYKNYDHLVRRRADSCKSDESGPLKNYLQKVPLLPSGATIKATCKAYRDYGCPDQLDAAKGFVTEIFKRGRTEGTFTVYNRQSDVAHMRCSVGFRPFFYNEQECPFEIPGDGDSVNCSGCPK